MDSNRLIQESILHDMSEGVLTIGFDGLIHSVNPAACRILDVQESEMIGSSFASCFFSYEENDAFNQAILDAVYDTSSTHENVVDYFTGTHIRQLHLTTAYLRDGEKKIGIIVVLGDISELVELRDAVKAMECIKKLNVQLELRNQLISKAFGRYLSDEIVKSLLDTPGGLAMGGEKKTLTVLMSDLRGFTSISEQMPPQALVEMLNHYLGEMTGIIQKRNGIIIDFMGDGILAVFGSPVGNITLENTEYHATDAVVCAVEMQAAMEWVNEWNRERGHPALQMGIGVNTGEMIVGNIGSDKRTKYDVVGQHVNLCGRIESYTVGGQVLISPKTKEAVSASLEVVQEVQISPKGVKTPLTISDVTAVGAPYDVHCVPYDVHLVRLCVPVETELYRITDKHCDETAAKGRLIALSPVSALLETECPLENYSDIKLDFAAGEALAKVLKQKRQGYYVSFTSLPKGFKEWIKEFT